MDLNADLGESAGDDSAVLDVVTSASVACGVHAGDTATMRRTVSAALVRGVAVGAHPSYPDRAGFGRRAMDLSPAQIIDETLAQVGTLVEVARQLEGRVSFIKPHGALYNRMAEDEACARALAEAAQRADDLVLLAPAGSPAVAVARRAGARVATEAFADRAYLPDGRLVPRAHPEAVLTDVEEVTARAVAIALHHAVESVDGATVKLEAASICVHGDTPGAARLARHVRDALLGAGIELRAFSV